MKKTQSKKTLSFFAKNKEALVVGGVIVVLAGAGLTYYYIQKKKDKKKEMASNDASIKLDTSSSSSEYKTPPFVPSGTSSSSSKPVITKKGYPIKYGSRNADVKILQRYLKIYKEDLGRSGSKRDGVDGIFGPKTSKAAQKRLGKTVFAQADIAGMRKALLSLGK